MPKLSSRMLTGKNERSPTVIISNLSALKHNVTAALAIQTRWPQRDEEVRHVESQTRRLDGLALHTSAEGRNWVFISFKSSKWLINSLVLIKTVGSVFKYSSSYFFSKLTLCFKKRSFSTEDLNFLWYSVKFSLPEIS